jgi:hypothetical protein
MLNPLPLANSTVKNTCEHYQRLINESSTVEQELSAFGSALSKTLIALALRESSWRPHSLPEIRDLREAVWAMMEKSRERLQRECTFIVEVTTCIRKVSHEFRQLLDVVRV